MQIWILCIEGENAYDIVKQFRHVIGRSYIPPKFRFRFRTEPLGLYTQRRFPACCKRISRESYPIDMIYMDIDYMQSFKDFTLSEENFPDFPEFVQEMKDQGLRLIPIIDAGVKVEPDTMFTRKASETTISARERTEVISLQPCGREILTSRIC